MFFLISLVIASSSAQAQLHGSNVEKAYTITYATQSAEPLTEDSCSQIDLINNEVLSMWHTWRNQAPTNWCTSYTVADILSYKLKIPISAIAIGSKYHSAQFLPLSEATGPSIEAIQQARLSGFLGIGAAFYQIISSIRNHGVCSSEHLDDQISIYQLVQSAGKKDAVSFVNDKVELSCQKNYSLPDIAVTYILPAKIGGSLASEINKLLEVGEMPGLSFQITKLFSPGVIVQNADAIPYHAVSINARKWNPKTNRCEYRIRTSAGWPTCVAYSPETTCNQSELTSQMHLWVDASFIDNYGAEVAVVSVGQ